MNLDTKTPQNVLAVCREHDLKVIDLRFTDFVGQFQRIVVPVSRLADTMFEEGLSLEGSQLASWVSSGQSSQATGPTNGETSSPLILVPLADTAIIDRWSPVPTMMLLCVIQDAVTREDWRMDPRVIAARTLSHCTNIGLADNLLVASQLVFQVSRSQTMAFQRPQWVSHRQVEWDDPTLTAIGANSIEDLVGRLTHRLLNCGVPIECIYAQAPHGGRITIRILSDTLIRAADWIVLTRSLIHSAAHDLGWAVNFFATSMADSTSEMNSAIRFMRGGESIFSGVGNKGLSDAGQHAHGGIWHHLGSIAAMTTSATSCGDGDVVERVGFGSSRANDSSMPIERRLKLSDSRQPALCVQGCDMSANPYLGYSAIALAALDGIQNKIGSGGDTRLAAFSNEKGDGVSSACRLNSLEEALDCLENDHEYLIRSEAFSTDVIEALLAIQRRMVLGSNVVKT